MRTILLSHNKAAYKKVMQAFETADRTCVVHPTGTGKSYLIAAVSESFKRVLILGPNTFVLDQVHSVLKWRDKATDAGRVEYMTYSLLTYRNQVPTGYDLICLDEFHRAGAPEWGIAVRDLLDANRNAKIFGTTATPIRYLDDERNMAHELFDDNVASQMTIGDAWSRNILPIPAYVTGLFDFMNVIADAEERIRDSVKLSSEEKRQRLVKLSNAKLEWENSMGMPSILSRHLDKDIRRVLVFCANIERLESMRDTVVGWFRVAGFKVHSTCTVHVNQTDKQLREAMETFESDEGDGVRLMFSIDMLNEGVHIPRVGAVLMLRTTASRIIFLQQMGRCLTAANTEKPVVLDMVDNISTTSAMHGVDEDFEQWLMNVGGEMSSHGPRRFEVVDYKKTIREVLQKLSPLELSMLTLEDRIKMVLDYCNEHGHTPRMKDGDIYRHYRYIVTYHRDHPEVQAILEKYHVERKTTLEHKEAVRAFLTEYNRAPTVHDGDIYNDWRILIAMRMFLNDPEVDQWALTYSKVRDQEYQKQEVIDFCRETGRLPYYKTERRLYSWVKHNMDELKEDPVVGPLLAKRVRERTFEEKRDELIAFIRRVGRVPKTRGGEEDEERYRYYYKTMHKQLMETDAEYAAIINGFEEQKRQETLGDVKRVNDFITQTGRIPSRGGVSDEEKGLVAVIRKLKCYRSDLPEVQEMLSRIKDIREGNGCVARLLAFEKEYGRLPRNSKDATPEERSLRNSIKYVMQHHADEPAVKELFARYPDGNNRLADNISRVRKFYSEHGRLPHVARDTPSEEKKAYTALAYLRRCYPDHPLVVEMMKDGGYTWGGWGKKGIPHSDIDAKLAQVESFAEKKGYMPSAVSSDKKEASLYYMWKNIMKSYPSHPKVAEIKSKYHSRVRIVNSIKRIRDYCDKIGCLPRFSRKDKEENKMCCRLWYLKKNYPNDPELKALLEKYDKQS